MGHAISVRPGSWALAQGARPTPGPPAGDANVITIQAYARGRLVSIRRTGCIIAAMPALLLAIGCADEDLVGPAPRHAVPDSIPPAVVLDLVAETVTPSTVLLTWTASGDDGRRGRASVYDIRHSFSPKMDPSGGHWDSATPIAYEISPSAVGRCDCLLVTDLEPDTLYYFGIRVADDALNWSGVSNVAGARTQIQAPAWGFYDGELLALEVSGQLLAPTELVCRISEDLALIRAKFPYMRSIGVLPDWYPGQITVLLTQEALDALLRGQYHGLDELNRDYGPVEVYVLLARPGGVQGFVLKFSRAYNPELLSDIYREAPGVLSASASRFHGDGSDITVTEPETYTFVRAWGDCPSGCVYKHSWMFTATGCEVSLIAEYGDPLPVALDR